MYVSISLPPFLSPFSSPLSLVCVSRFSPFLSLTLSSYFVPPPLLVCLSALFPLLVPPSPLLPDDTHPCVFPFSSSSSPTRFVSASPLYRRCVLELACVLADPSRGRRLYSARCVCLLFHSKQFLAGSLTVLKLLACWLGAASFQREKMYPDFIVFIYPFLWLDIKEQERKYFLKGRRGGGGVTA